MGFSAGCYTRGRRRKFYISLANTRFFRDISVRLRYVPRISCYFIDFERENKKKDQGEAKIRSALVTHSPETASEKDIIIL